MYPWIEEIVVWAEVWALLIPLIFLFRDDIFGGYISPIVIYIYLAFMLNFLANLIESQDSLSITLPWNNNIILYNLHFIARLTFFFWFFWNLRIMKTNSVWLRVFLLFALIITISLTLYESVFEEGISSYAYSLGTLLLLFYCLRYYWAYLKLEQVFFTRLPSFWIVTGLATYLVITFPVFLFYRIVLDSDPALANSIWNIHNIAFTIFCFFIAAGFKMSSKSKSPQYE